MKLLNVYQTPGSVDTLYALLLERTQEQSISHKGAVHIGDHIDFVNSRPYLAWYLIEHEAETIGATYLTHQREIGIFLFKEHQGQSLGRQAVALLMAAHPGRFLANIAPTNPGSYEFFKNMGFRHIQNTLELHEAS